MTVGSRLKEERSRLGCSQTAFAEVAGVKKGTQISWEKDASSPSAQALVAFASAGADVLYILTGRRLPNLPDPVDEMIEGDLREARRNLVDPLRVRRPTEDFDKAEQRVVAEARILASRILLQEVPAGLRDALVEETKALLHLAENPAELPVLRAAEFAHDRERRVAEKQLLMLWFKGSPYHPIDSVMTMLADLALQYLVPHKMLVELCDEVFSDIASRNGDVHKITPRTDARQTG